MVAPPADKLDESLADGRLCDDFLRDLAYRRRASANTVAAYRADLHRFIDFLGAELKISVTRSSRADVLAFLVSCEKRGESARTRSRRLSSLRAFFSFLKDRGRIQESPVTGVRGARFPGTLPKMLSVEEMRLILDAGRTGGKSQRRSGMLVELMYAAGLRVSEAVRLRVEHLLLDENAVLVESGKGGKGRVVVLPDVTVMHLREYLETVRTLILEGGHSRWVFPTKSGNPLDRHAAWRGIKELGAAAGLSSPVYPHILRHTCATHLLENGCDLLTVQALLGHADISTTEIYTHVLTARKQAVFKKAHPRA